MTTLHFIVHCPVVMWTQRELKLLFSKQKRKLCMCKKKCDIYTIAVIAQGIVWLSRVSGYNFFVQKYQQHDFAVKNSPGQGEVLMCTTILPMKGFLMCTL